MDKKVRGIFFCFASSFLRVKKYPEKIFPLFDAPNSFSRGETYCIHRKEKEMRGRAKGEDFLAAQFFFQRQSESGL